MGIGAIMGMEQEGWESSKNEAGMMGIGAIM
jgi:hypothetical protein